MTVAYLCEYEGDCKKTPDIDGFGVRRSGKPISNLLIEGVEHQQGGEGHHDSQV